MAANLRAITKDREAEALKDGKDMPLHDIVEMLVNVCAFSQKISDAVMRAIAY
jgi:hypothetical protein